MRRPPGRTKKLRGEAQREMNALVLFKGDMGGFVRIYAFRSQIFDYGDTSIGC